MKFKYKLFFLVVWVSVVLFIISILLSRFLFFRNLDSNIGASIANIFPLKANPNIVVIEIDDISLNKLGFPLERKDINIFLQNLQLAQPWIVGIDIFFWDKWKDSQIDQELADMMKNMGNIILWADRDREWKNNTWIPPYDIFTQSSLWVGYFLPTIDPSTYKVFSLRPFEELYFKGEVWWYESFSFSILRGYFNFLYNRNEVIHPSHLTQWIYEFFTKKIPIQKGEFYIDYLPSSSFQRISFYEIHEGKYDMNKLRDKMVLVWYTASWVKDDFFIPGNTNHDMMKWVYIHTNAINNILNESYIVYISPLTEYMIWFLFIFFIVYLNTFYVKYVHLRWMTLGAVFVFILVVVLYSILFAVVFQKSWVKLLPNYPFEFFVLLFLSFFASSILKYLNEDKNKQKLSEALSTYVSDDIAREILTSSWEISLSGEKKTISIFFSDIAWFTTISEKLSPEELVSFLRVYLSEMSHIILDHKGFINKYEWDAIMALWWVFGKHTDRFWVYDACFAALLQQKRLKELNEVWKQEQKDVLFVRMGIHTWEAIIWNIGAQGRKMEFTALGDSVNLASRLEWVNKFYGTHICVSQSVVDRIGDDFEFRKLDIIQVKGKEIWVPIYELLAMKWELGVFQKNIILDFEKGLQKYFEKDFEVASEIFEKLSKLWDEPSKVFHTRCRVFIQYPPENTWDGIWKMDEK